MKARAIYPVLVLLFTAFLFKADAFAETTCEIDNCNITIRIKIAFSGATDQLIEAWKNDIEDTWNGDGQVTGDCKCPVIFIVETMKITDPKQINCNPPPQGYHCVMVTDYHQNPPKDTKGNIYMGYMYPPGVSKKGQSLKGWWSNLMNRPTDDPSDPQAEIYHDAAHEAGHMMGLKDGEGDGLMSHTSGDKAKPTQANIDAAVSNVCGPNACPRRCCCGNGEVEPGMGEGCDPNADPIGCGFFEECCPICCRCFIPTCIPENGEYNTQEGCEVNCTGYGSSCYKNYRTGCWDCVKSKIVEHKPAYDPSRIVNCDHQEDYYYTLLLKLVDYDFHWIPMACPLLFGTERIHLFIDGVGSFYLITFDCKVSEVTRTPLDFLTMFVTTDTDTVDAIAAEELTFEEALASGKIVYKELE